MLCCCEFSEFYRKDIDDRPITRFFPETLRTLVGDGSIPPSKWNRALIPIIGRNSVVADSETPPPKPIPNPFKLLTYPDLLIVLCNSGIIVASYYAVNATISSFFTVNYPFLTELEIGLCFLSIGAGGVAGTITGGKLLDRQYQYYKRKYELKVLQRSEKMKEATDGMQSPALLEDEDAFPIEKARLVSQQILVWIFGASVIGYGWAIQAKTNIAVPLILQFISELRKIIFEILSLFQCNHAYSRLRDDRRSE